jgi:hypothetical protein
MILFFKVNPFANKGKGVEMVLLVYFFILNT